MTVFNFFISEEWPGIRQYIYKNHYPSATVTMIFADFFLGPRPNHYVKQVRAAICCRTHGLKARDRAFRPISCHFLFLQENGPLCAVLRAQGPVLLCEARGPVLWCEPRNLLFLISGRQRPIRGNMFSSNTCSKHTRDLSRETRLQKLLRCYKV